MKIKLFGFFLSLNQTINSLQYALVLLALSFFIVFILKYRGKLNNKND